MKCLYWVCLLVLLATGVKADDIRTRAGQVYRNVRVTASNAEGVTVVHSAGVTKILFLDMPEELQNKYGYDPAANPQKGSGLASDGNTTRKGNVIATGTGFFVTKDGFLLTAGHVVARGKTIKVDVAGKTFEAKVIRADFANDVALLKAEGEFSALAIEPSRGVKLGSDIFTVGFPNIGIQGAAPKLSKGTIGALSGIQDDPRAFQVSLPMQPGNSGGPLLDASGNVVGIVVGQLDALKMARLTGSLPQGVNYAVKSAYVQPLLEAIPESSVLLPSAKARAFDDAVKAAESAICIVLVYEAAQ